MTVSGRSRKDSTMPKLLTAALAASLALALCAGPAAARPAKSYAYYATIDCGSGPIEVGSGEDLFAPLVNLSSGRRYKPVAWDVSVGDSRIQEVKPGAKLKHAVDCSYTDGVATGTVTVARA
jgi:hypothetical protein